MAKFFFYWAVNPPSLYILPLGTQYFFPSINTTQPSTLRHSRSGGVWRLTMGRGGLNTIHTQVAIVEHYRTRGTERQTTFDLRIKAHTRTREAFHSFNNPSPTLYNCYTHTDTGLSFTFAFCCGSRLTPTQHTGLLVPCAVY